MRLDEGMFWPNESLHASIEALLLASGLPLAAASLGNTPAEPVPGLGWVRRAVRRMGFDVHMLELTRAEIPDHLSHVEGPCLLTLFSKTEGLRYAATVFEGRVARVVRQDGVEATLTRGDLIDVFMASSPVTELEPIFDGLDGSARAVRGLRNAGIDAPGARLYQFALDATHPIWTQLVAGGGIRSLFAYAGLLALQGAAGAAALWTLGSAAVDGRADLGRIVAWTVLALTQVPLQYLGLRAVGRFSILLSSILKRRLLEGTFRIDEHEIRRQGFGVLLARTNEASVVESVSLADVLAGPTALVPLIVSVALFQRSNLFGPLVGITLVAVVLVCALGALSVRSYGEVYDLRLQLTDDLVGKLIGHRTRLIQEIPSQHHIDEDVELASYFRATRHNDNIRTAYAVFSRMWFIGAGILILAGFVERDTSASLAFAVVGTIFAGQSFGALLGAFDRFAQLATAYRGVGGMLAVGRTRDRPPRKADIEIDDGIVATVLSVSSLSYSYREGARAIFNDAALRVRSGDRVLVTGASGGGKSTLFKLIAGELRPTGGILLVSGADCYSTSERDWRQRVASAPQFHENYVFSQTFAFNLDPRGRSTDPSDEAIEVCRELGLDALVERMPQRYAQLLGETGWQLSHGERSRLFIARALLQHGDVMLLDESLGALDPETQLRVLACVRKRARTLMVIAHA